VHFVIDIDGSVRRPQLVSDEGVDQAVGACVVRAIRDVSFPPPEGGTVAVTYPFVFSPDA
jgi:outer membrane biosynthesis protein TonB